jgi:fission 1 protein
MFGVSAASLSDGRDGVPEKREILYLLAVGQFRAAEYARSRRLVDQALQVGYLSALFRIVQKSSIEIF